MPDERALWIECEGDAMAAVLHPVAAAKLGVVIVVGGPQYRIGSHRQFLLLARRLAAAGFPVLRFDFRGMGDSSGEQRDFETVDADIRAAVDGLVANSSVRRVVLWGLCDGASAALMYAPGDPRIAGLIALNPWVHSVQGEAQARIRGYYAKRLCNREFWGKVLRLEFDWRDSLKSLSGYARAAARPITSGGGARDFVARMEEAFTRYPGRLYIALSGNDLTADEFRLLLKSSPSWGALVSRKATLREHPDANHTFASREWRGWIEDLSLAWLREIAGGSP